MQTCNCIIATVVNLTCSGDNGGSSTGAIAGGVIGGIIAIVVIVIVIIVIYWLVRKGMYILITK